MMLLFTSSVACTRTNSTLFGPKTECFKYSIQLFLNGFLNFFFVASFKFVFQFFFVQCVSHRKTVILQSIFRLNFFFVHVVLCLEFLCFLNHAVNLGLRKTTFLVSDRYLVALTRGFVLCASTFSLFMSSS